MTKLIAICSILILSSIVYSQKHDWEALDIKKLEELTTSKNPTEAATAKFYLGSKLEENELDRKMELYLQSYHDLKKLKETEIYYKAGTKLISGYIIQGKEEKAKGIILENTQPGMNVQRVDLVIPLWDRYVNYITQTGDKKAYQKSIDEFHEFVKANPTDIGWYNYYKRVGSSAYSFGDLSASGAAFEAALPYMSKVDNSERAGLLMNIGVIRYRNGQLDEALLRFRSSASVFEKEKDALNSGHAYLNLASVYLDKSNHDSANVAIDKAMKFYHEAKDSASMFNAMEYKALIAQNEHKLDVALKLHLKILEYRKGIKDDRSIAMTYQNMASVYATMKDFKQQLKFLQASGAISTANQNPSGLATFYTSMSSYYMNQKLPDSALFYAKKQLENAIVQGNKRWLLSANLTIGNVYKENFNELDRALGYYIIAYDLAVELNMSDEIAGLGHNIGVIYEEKGDYKKARKYVEAAYEIRKKLDNKDFLMDSYQTLANVYTGLKMYKESNQYLWKYIEMKDSLYSDQMTEKIVEMRTLYETQQIEDSLQLSKQSEENAVLNSQKSEAENKRKAEQIFWLIGILILAGGAIFIAIRSNRQRKKANVNLKYKNEEITLQKEIIEEKNKDITDSINYAKRIQSAILPPSKLIKEHLPESFVLYKPKDIVAGDFYWMEPSKDGLLFAAADCTGHGVPGAMVSVVCNNGLNRSVREYGLTDPGKILDKTRELVIKEFEMSEEEVKDGMDIALISLSKQELTNGSNDEQKGMPVTQLRYAGANNPLLILRKGAFDLEEIKPNKQPIGKFDSPEPYTTHKIDLYQGDSFYIFTDGYSDQFGGEKGKKYKIANFKRLILSIQNETMEQQKVLADQAFENWKGDNEQLDDVCVIGVKI